MREVVCSSQTKTPLPILWKMGICSILELMNQLLLYISALMFIVACKNQKPKLNTQVLSTVSNKLQDKHKNPDSIRTIHVMVALCDNKYQGIVPVPAAIGNGQNPATNLYWGAGYGVKSFFSRTNSNWMLVEKKLNPEKNILERLLFRHRKHAVYLLADAYDGQFIRNTTIDFLNASAGNLNVSEKKANQEIFFGGAADLVAYIGHDGMMDFSLSEKFSGDTLHKRETIILACYSKRFFQPHLKLTGAQPLLWTSGLMAPEAYTLYDAVEAWIDKKGNAEIRQSAAKAYSKYQKCSNKAAYNLLVTGW